MAGEKPFLAVNVPVCAWTTALGLVGLPGLTVWSVELSAAFNQNMTVQHTGWLVYVLDIKCRLTCPSIYTCSQACWTTAIPFKGSKIKPSCVAHTFLEAAGKKMFALQPQKGIREGKPHSGLTDHREKSILRVWRDGLGKAVGGIWNKPLQS